MNKGEVRDKLGSVQIQFLIYCSNMVSFIYHHTPKPLELFKIRKQL